MSSSSMSVAFAVIVTVACFSGVCLSMPAVYPIDSVSESGLVREIIFDEDDPSAFEYVSARLVYVNPSDSPVTFNLTYPVTFGYYVDGVRVSRLGRLHQLGEWEIVTIPPHGEYVVTNGGFLPEKGGWYEIEWDDVRRGVDVRGSPIVPRIITDHEKYRVGDGGGTATFEYYNPTQYNVTFHVPSTFEFVVIHPDETVGNGVVIDYEWVFRDKTLPPDGSFIVEKFYFATTKTGELTLVVNDVKKIIQVLPR